MILKDDSLALIVSVVILKMSCTHCDPCTLMSEIYDIMYMFGYSLQIYKPPIKVTDVEVQKVCQKSTPMYYSTDKILKYLWAIKVFYG